jgi:hypothetical protein
VTRQTLPEIYCALTSPGRYSRRRAIAYTMFLNDAPSTSPMLLKGKLTNRSWAQLPEEIIRSVNLGELFLDCCPCAPKRVLLIAAFNRLIATHYLLDVSISNHCPSTWENRRLWPNKMVYTIIRDAFDVEKHLMGVCPEWHKASEYYPALSFLSRRSFVVFYTGMCRILI